MRRYLGFLLLALGVGITLGVFYTRSSYSKKIRTFSPYTLLTSSWEKYKIRFINKDGRVIDYSQNGITTSEGQSYAMLQAVWIDDKETFDLVWKWTKDTLKRPNDNLFGWRWGNITKDKYGLLPNGGDNTASDADNDIALALVLAAKRWNNPKYLDDAKPIISDIWKIEVNSAGGNNYMTAGNWAAGGDKIIVNPSYFSPYAWRLFSQVDIKNNWMSLIDPAYALLNKSSQMNLDKSNFVGLPPDWIAVYKNDGRAEATGMPGLSTNYGYDAMRIPFRIAIDYLWNKESKAKGYLSSLSFLKNYYQNNAKLIGTFGHDGQVVSDNENPAMYATSLGYFTVMDPVAADRIYQDKIVQLYSNDTNSFKDDLPYYEENWLWFGTALYLHYLIQF